MNESQFSELVMAWNEIYTRYLKHQYGSPDQVAAYARMGEAIEALRSAIDSPPETGAVEAA